MGVKNIITFDAPNTAAYASSGLLYDISDLIPKEDQDKFYSLNVYDGRLYGLPIQESSAGFFYNKKIFRAAGMDEVKVTPVTTAEYPASKAKRPMNSRISKEKLSDNGFERLPEWKDAVARYLKEITW